MSNQSSGGAASVHPSGGKAGKATKGKIRSGSPAKTVKWSIYHVLVAGGALIMVYPVIWLLMSSFKPSDKIFVTSDSLIPDP
ncbi:MAG: carbohydrate transporter permease, partial [Paenibacillus sp.]|nr:carbohydrate transporter permease [Paenibacillus sp.]